MIETTDEARSLFKNAGLKYSDLTRKNLQLLRNIINKKMKSSGLMENSLRCHQRPVFQPDADRFWAAIRCRAFYFDDREAISFNRDGFIGFAGWADSKHLLVVLDGFEQWVGEITGHCAHESSGWCTKKGRCKDKLLCGDGTAGCERAL